MPHVVIEEALDLPAVCSRLQLSTSRQGAEILKVVDLYQNRAGRMALVDCVAIEEGKSQSFFVLLSQKDRQITVRLLPATDPEKTPGVKRLMASLARQIHDLVPGSRFGKTNLLEFLEEGPPPAA